MLIVIIIIIVANFIFSFGFFNNQMPYPTVGFLTVIALPNSFANYHKQTQTFHLTKL